MHLSTNASSMQIGEVAKLTALSVDAIRFYERTALLPKLPRTPGRFRVYTDRDVERLSFIRRMQGLGFSLREVRQILDLRENRLDVCKEVRGLIQAKIRQVQEKIRELTALENELAAGLRQCDAERKRRPRRTSGTCPVLETSILRASHDARTREQ